MVKITVEFKRNIVGSSIFHIIIGKFSHQQQLSLIILLVVAISLKISLYCIVLSLSLAVSLEMKDVIEFLLNT